MTQNPRLSSLVVLPNLIKKTLLPQRQHLRRLPSTLLSIRLDSLFKSQKIRQQISPSKPPKWVGPPHRPLTPFQRGKKKKQGMKVQLTKVSGSTSICGVAPLNFISCFPTLRQFFTGSMRLRRLYEAIVPVSMPEAEVKRMLVLGIKGENIGREMMGCTVAMLFGRGVG